MAFHAAQCPSCKKNIQVPDDVEASICMYCGHSILVKDATYITVGPSITNLLGLARTADIAGNAAEAETYYNRVLEIDPTISEAWIGKGKSAGWQSSVVNMRFGEVLTSFGHAIGTAPEREKPEIISSCVNEVNRLVVTLYGMARKHMLEYVALRNTWAEYLNQVGQMLTTLETAGAWLPTDKTTLENIVHLCKDNIEGVNYRDPYDNNTAKNWHLTPQYEALIRQKLDAAASALKAIDPTYAPPAVEKKKPDSCFVVTATMGDAQHPTVNLLRRFRDQWILTQPGGRTFVSWYYHHGPQAANFIRHSRLLRALSFILIVTPAAWLARRFVK
jgi:DNA-directed RNA polymerase subunit RPC12/RpoP